MLSLIPFLALIIVIITFLGLIKPSFVPLLKIKNSNKNRFKVLGFGFVSFIFLVILTLILQPTKEEIIQKKKVVLLNEKKQKSATTYTLEEKEELAKVAKIRAKQAQKEKENLAKKAQEKEDKKILDDARRDLFKDYIRKEKKVLDAYWYNDHQLWITMFNNGRDRSGYADYICVESKTWGKDDKLKFKNAFMIIIYDAIKMNSNNFIKMGEFHCKP